MAYFAKINQQKVSNEPSKKEARMTENIRRSKCKRSGCDGVIDFNQSIELPNNKEGHHPCNKCGLLHWENGEEIVNFSRQLIFSINGKATLRE